MKKIKIKYKLCQKCGREITGSKYTRGINFIYHDWCYWRKWGYHHE